MNSLPFRVCAVIAVPLLGLATGCHDRSHVAEATDASAAKPRFFLFPFTTNGLRAEGLIDQSNRQFVRLELFETNEGKPSCVTFWYHGRDVFELHFVSNHPPVRVVPYFDDTNHLEVNYFDRGGFGHFAERLTYESGGEKVEVLYGAGWHELERRDGQRGIVLDGRWTPMTFTNGVWAPKPGGDAFERDSALQGQSASQ